jgi:hypothetical protein
MAHRPFPPLLQYTKNDFCACERARRPWVWRRVPKTSKNTTPKSCPAVAHQWPRRAIQRDLFNPHTVIMPWRLSEAWQWGQEWGWVRGWRRGVNSHQPLARTATFHTPACRPCIQCHPNNTYTQADERESIGWGQAVHTPHGAASTQQHTSAPTHDTPARAADPPMAHRPFLPLLQYTENDFCACERARRPWVWRRVPKTTKNTTPKSCPQNAPPALTSGRAAPSGPLS